MKEALSLSAFLSEMYQSECSQHEVNASRRTQWNSAVGQLVQPVKQAVQAVRWKRRHKLGSTGATHWLLHFKEGTLQERMTKRKMLAQVWKCCSWNWSSHLSVPILENALLLTSFEHPSVLLLSSLPFLLFSLFLSFIFLSSESLSLCVSALFHFFSSDCYWLIALLSSSLSFLASLILLSARALVHSPPLLLLLYFLFLAIAITFLFVCHLFVYLDVWMWMCSLTTTTTATTWLW